MKGFHPELLDLKSSQRPGLHTARGGVHPKGVFGDKEALIRKILGKMREFRFKLTQFSFLPDNLQRALIVTQLIESQKSSQSESETIQKVPVDKSHAK